MALLQMLFIWPAPKKAHRVTLEECSWVSLKEALTSLLFTYHWAEGIHVARGATKETETEM